MYFYDEVPLSVTSSKPVKTWNLASYSEFQFHFWAQGQPNAKVYPEFYFNQLSGYGFEFNLGAGGVAWTTRTIPITAPNVGLVLYNPSSAMNVSLRIYAACCTQSEGLLLKWPISFKKSSGFAMKEVPEIKESMFVQANT